MLPITLSSAKISHDLRICLISDTHSSDYGPGQHQLLDLVRAQAPDLILLAGDIYDEDRSHRASDELLRGLATLAPSFYTTGNHDLRCMNETELADRVRDLGIQFLDGRTQELRLKEQKLSLSGLSDPSVNRQKFQQQMKRIIPSEGYHIVISHQPQWISSYEQLPVDLIVSGHAHGGQWNIGGQGVFAPAQGLFPKHTKGHYRLASQDLVVSPGLVREFRPRWGNPPSLVVITLKGEV